MVNKYIVGVVGSQNTGKTTFIKDVIEATASRDNPQLSFVGGAVDYRQKIEDAGLKINRNGDPASQQIIFDCLCENISRAVDNLSSHRIILDRTPIDAYVYTIWHKRYNKDVTVPDQLIETMFSRMLHYLAMLDRIIYIPLEHCDDVVVVDDKFRDTDLNYRRQIDSIFKETFLDLSNHGCKGHSEIYGPRIVRVKRFLELERIDEEFFKTKPTIKGLSNDK